MLLQEMPLELLQQIVELVLQNDSPRNLTALLGVNSAFETETTKLYLRTLRNIKPGAPYWDRVPLPIRRRLAWDSIMSKPGSDRKRNIATYMHAVASFLSQYAKVFDAEDTGRLNSAQWLHEICDVLAPSEADCRCGKPAFLHSKCYSLSSVPDTAFHVAILKRHAKLEMAMIEEGRSVGSVCPYLKVSKKDPMFTRRNALEWACAYGYDDSVRRLLTVAEEQGLWSETFLPTAVAICAARCEHDEGHLLRFLLKRLDKATEREIPWIPNLQYQNKTITCRELDRLVLVELAKRKMLDAILLMFRHYPYYRYWAFSNLPPKNLIHSRFTRDIWEAERPYCDLLYRDYDENFQRLHWVRCNRDLCRHRYSKANPQCGGCGRHHVVSWRSSTYTSDGWPRALYVRIPEALTVG